MTKSDGSALPVKPWLSKSAETLRAQVNVAFPERDKSSDGWLGDLRHAARKSDHNPDPTGCVRGLDLDADLAGRGNKPDYMPDLADQLRLCAKADKRKRISYIIYNGKIASPKRRWAWRKYTGINQHTKHAHISFSETADLDTTTFAIPLLKEPTE